MSNYELGYFSIKNQAILELKPNVFRTYCYFISKDYKGEGIWHSQETIAKELGVCVRTVQRHIKQLKEKSFLKSRRRGFNMTNLYTMLKHIVTTAKGKKEELTNNFKKKFTTSKNKSKNLKFDNFKGRDYSEEEMDSLELKLLGWD